MIYLLKKELLEVIRDRRTLFNMIIVPLVAFPVIIGVTGYFAKRGMEKISSMKINVFLYAETQTDSLRAYLKEQNLILLPTTQPVDSVSKETPAAIFVYPGEIDVLYDAASEKGQEALKRIRFALDKYRDFLIKTDLSDMGVPEDVLNPFKLKVTTVTAGEKILGMTIGMFLGYLLVIMMFSSAMYASIDLTAGEKERRTMEVLLSAAPSRKNIVFAKVTIVSLVAFITSVLLVISWILSTSYLGEGMFTVSSASLTSLITPGMLVSILILITPFAVFVSSLEVTIAAFARSFKEAQSYLTPLLMIAILPAILTVLPGISEWSTWKAFVPVMNISSALKELMQNGLPAKDFALTFVANIVYTIVATLASVYLFSREEILFRE